LGPPTPRGCRRLQLRPMDSQISIAFIGGGNMASALAAGLAGRTCPAGNLHALDPSPDVQESWRARGATASATPEDRKSTRLNSSHVKISYAVFCLKKKTVEAAQNALTSRAQNAEGNRHEQSGQDGRLDR